MSVFSFFFPSFFLLPACSGIVEDKAVSLPLPSVTSVLMSNSLLKLMNFTHQESLIPELTQSDEPSEGSHRCAVNAGRTEASGSTGGRARCAVGRSLTKVPAPTVMYFKRTPQGFQALNVCHCCDLFKRESLRFEVFLETRQVLFLFCFISVNPSHFPRPSPTLAC